MIHTTIVIPQITSQNFTTVILHGKYLWNINYIHLQYYVQSTYIYTIYITLCLSLGPGCCYKFARYFITAVTKYCHVSQHYIHKGHNLKRYP